MCPGLSYDDDTNDCPSAEEQGGCVVAPERPSYVTRRENVVVTDEEQPVAALPNLPDYGMASADDSDGRK
jgi:hypothetical protein